jgi:hypothetical protein
MKKRQGKMTPRERAPIVHSAVHEAGHVVIGRVLGLPKESRVMIYREGGIVRHDSPTQVRNRRMAAGAEKIILGRHDGGDGGDRYQIKTSSLIFALPLCPPLLYSATFGAEEWRPGLRF